MSPLRLPPVCRHRSSLIKILITLSSPRFWTLSFPVHKLYTVSKVQLSCFSVISYNSQLPSDNKIDSIFGRANFVSNLYSVSNYCLCLLLDNHNDCICIILYRLIVKKVCVSFPQWACSSTHKQKDPINTQHDTVTCTQHHSVNICT